MTNKVSETKKSDNLPFQDYHNEKLQDKEYAKAYLEVALEEYESDGDTHAFYAALKDVVKAQGGMTEIARKTNLNRQNLYKALSGERKPKLETISHLIHGLGYKFSLQSIK